MCVLILSSSVCASAVLSNHDDECVTSPLPNPTLFAIIPRIWTHYRTRPNTSAPNQGQAPFWFHTNARMLIGEKNPNGWRLLLLTQTWRTISPFITTPSVTKPATENAYMTRFMFFAEPPHNPPSAPLERRGKKNGWSLPLVLFNYCFVVQDVQEMSPLLSLKTLESVHMHCELGKSLSCHFMPFSPCILCHERQLT